MHHENAIGILDFEMQNDLYIYMHNYSQSVCANRNTSDYTYISI